MLALSPPTDRCPFKPLSPSSAAFFQNAVSSSASPVVKVTFMIDGKIDEEVMQVGEVVPMEDDEGNELVGVVVEIEADVVHVDFNHPLAGLDLHFEGVVVAIGK